MNVFCCISEFCTLSGQSSKDANDDSEHERRFDDRSEKFRDNSNNVDCSETTEGTFARRNARPGKQNQTARSSKNIFFIPVQRFGFFVHF